MGASQSHVKTPESVVEPISGGQAKPLSGGHENNEARVPDGREEDDGYAGLKAIRKVCHELHANQGNHLVAAAPIKSWLGGPDPLDYVEMYSNSGDPGLGVPPHWHYVTCGFSDLHGDERVHQYSGPRQESGFGFELTLRLKKQNDEQYPPMWPTGLFNALARYVFQTGSILYVGDHMPWHKPLDGQDDSQSIIKHLLIAKDPQLTDVDGPLGKFDFRQLVGVTEDEMTAAQRWKGTGVLDLMRDVSQISPYLITDLARPQSIFEMDKTLMERVNEGIDKEGSDLGLLTSVCRWTETNSSGEEDAKNNTDSDGASEPETRRLEGVKLVFAREAADLLPVVVRGRLRKGRLFVYTNCENQAIHFVPSECDLEGIIVSQNEPLKAIGGSLQIHCSTSLIEDMSEAVKSLAEGSQVWGTGQHKFLEFSSMELGQTKFHPDRHFGLWKAKLRGSTAETMNQLTDWELTLSRNDNNIPQLVTDSDKPGFFYDELSSITVNAGLDAHSHT